MGLRQNCDVLKLKSLQIVPRPVAFFCALMGGGASAAASASFEVARVLFSIDGEDLANQLIWYSISYSTGCFKMVLQNSRSSVSLRQLILHFEKANCSGCFQMY